MTSPAHPTSLQPSPPTDPVATAATGVLSLGELLEHHPAPVPSFIEPALLPSSGILFLGGQPKLGKSVLAANLALALASGSSRVSFQVPAVRRVLICQFELPTAQFAQRLDTMRRSIGSAADSHLFVDTQAAGHLLTTPQGLDHFLASARAVHAEVIVLDPLYSTHDQDENDTRAMSALCQSLLRLRDGSGAALILIHHVKKAAGRHEIGSAFRGSSALHAVGDSYVLLSPVRRRLPRSNSGSSSLCPRSTTASAIAGSGNALVRYCNRRSRCRPYSAESRNRRCPERSGRLRPRSFQSTAPAHHGSVAMFTPHRSTRHSARLSTGFGGFQRWRLPAAIIITTSPRVAPR